MCFVYHMAASDRLGKTILLYMLIVFSSAQNTDINEYLNNWYYDRDNRHIILREGQSEHADMTRKCPPKIYYGNRLLCYTYWKNVIEGDTTFWGKIPDGRQRGMLEARDQQLHHGDGIGKSYQELRSNPQVSGIIEKSGANSARESRVLSKPAGRKNNVGRNSKVVLFHG